MKLATLRNNRPDGQLVIVSRDLSRYVAVGRIAPNLQSALDDWTRCEPLLSVVSDQLNNREIAGQVFDPHEALAPLPRAFSWIDGSGYMVHLNRVRTLKGSVDANLQDETPLLYQGSSDKLVGANAPIVVPEADLALDFEAELVAIIDAVPMRSTKAQAIQSIKLLGICNDTSLRKLVANDLQNGFGFFHSKPATSFAPVFVTLDELGDNWQNQLLNAKIRITVNDTLYGQPNIGRDVKFDLADIIVAATQTRELGVGTIIGSGTIANDHDEILPIKSDGIGFGCIAEARTAEKLKIGAARTPFLAQGDTLRIEAIDPAGNSIFGAISQKVEILGQS